MSRDMDRRREGLRRRQSSAMNNRGNRGLGTDIMDFSATNMKKYEPLDYQTIGKVNRIDIIPFVVTQPWYKDLLTPEKTRLGIEVGDIDYKFEAWIHYGIGALNISVPCRRNNFGEECLICNKYWEEKNRDDLTKEEAEAIKKYIPKLRNWFNVIDLNGDPNEILYWPIPYFKNFEELVLKEAKVEANKLGDPHFTWSELKGGKTITFKADKKPWGKSYFFECRDVSFENREEDYDQGILKETLSFDSLFKNYNKDEIEKMFFGGVDFVDDDVTPADNDPVIVTKEETKKVEEPVKKEEPKLVDDLNQMDRTALKNLVLDEKLVMAETITRKTSDDEIRTLIRKARKDKEVPWEEEKEEEQCDFGYKFGVDSGERGECDSDCDEDKWNRCCDTRKRREANARKAKS